MASKADSEHAGRVVVLEEEEGEDLASSADRLLKLVDQDFADVAGARHRHHPYAMCSPNARLADPDPTLKSADVLCLLHWFAFPVCDFSAH